MNITDCLNEAISGHSCGAFIIRYSPSLWFGFLGQRGIEIECMAPGFYDPITETVLPFFGDKIP